MARRCTAWIAMLRISALLSVLLVAGWVTPVAAALPDADPLPEVEVVDPVVFERYDGLWYEISSTPNFFEVGCFCTTATYTIQSADTLGVFNACNRFRPRGKLRTIEGTATLAGEGAEGKLLVTFPGPPVPADYWIVDVVDDPNAPAGDYTFAAVGGPNRDFLFILARDPILDTPEEQAAYQEVLSQLEDQLFDTGALKFTPQPLLCNYDGRE